MPCWSISGRWIGEYRYHPSPGLPANLPSVVFAMDIAEWEGKFRGRVQDDPSVGTPEPGAIEGVTDGRTVSFMKRMPVCFFNGPDGLQSLRDLVMQHWGMALDRVVPAPPIEYSGEFSADGEEVSSVWRIAEGTIFIPSGGEEYPLPCTGATGTWFMRRQRSG